MRSNSLSKNSVLEEEASLPRGRVRGRGRGRDRGSDSSVVGASSSGVPAVQCGEANGDRNKSFFEVSLLLFFLIVICCLSMRYI